MRKRTQARPVFLSVGDCGGVIREREPARQIFFEAAWTAAVWAILETL